MSAGAFNRLCPHPGCPHSCGRYGGPCKSHSDMASPSKRVTTAEPGRRTGKRLLDDDQCAEARKLSARFVAPVDIAERYGVSVKVVHNVLNRKGAYAGGES